MQLVVQNIGSIWNSLLEKLHCCDAYHNKLDSTRPLDGKDMYRIRHSPQENRLQSPAIRSIHRHAQSCTCTHTCRRMRKHTHTHIHTGRTYINGKAILLYYNLKSSSPNTFLFRFPPLPFSLFLVLPPPPRIAHSLVIVVVRDILLVVLQKNVFQKQQIDLFSKRQARCVKYRRKGQMEHYEQFSNYSFL